MTTWWTLMKDTTPIATYEFAGTSLNMLDEAHAYDVMDFLERHGAPALFAPINESVVLVGGSWSGKPVWQACLATGARGQQMADSGPS